MSDKKLTPEEITILAQLGLKYFPDLVLAISNLFKNSNTIDEAIAALEVAKTKTAQAYLDEAKGTTT